MSILPRGSTIRTTQEDLLASYWARQETGGAWGGGCTEGVQRFLVSVSDVERAMPPMHAARGTCISKLAEGIRRGKRKQARTDGAVEDAKWGRERDRRGRDAPTANRTETIITVAGRRATRRPQCSSHAASLFSTNPAHVQSIMLASRSSACEIRSRQRAVPLGAQENFNVNVFCLNSFSQRGPNSSNFDYIHHKRPLLES